MLISVIHPSRGRPEMAAKTCETWKSRAGKIEYLMILDYDDPELNGYKSIKATKYITASQNVVQATNKGAMFATGEILVVVSDDFDCPEDWDIKILNEVRGKSDFVLKTKDGLRKDDLVTLPIIHRDFYSRYRYIYHPDYSHMYADNHLTDVAKLTGKLLFSDLVFKHNHGNDSTYQRGIDTMETGKQIYERHKAQNFGILSK